MTVRSIFVDWYFMFRCSAPGLFSWFGKLPGDIRVDSERGRVFIPITSMIVVSVVLTLLLNLFRFLKF